MFIPGFAKSSDIPGSLKTSTSSSLQALNIIFYLVAVLVVFCIQIVWQYIPTSHYAQFIMDLNKH
jgi:hypothetical protein